MVFSLIPPTGMTFGARQRGVPPGPRGSRGAYGGAPLSARVGQARRPAGPDLCGPVVPSLRVGADARGSTR
eukprot:4768953-Pyramimonas_sp.AAC.1